MSDVALPSAGSSPASSPSTAPAAATSAETPALQVPRDKADYTKWRKTGELPGAASKPKAEGSAPSKESSDAPAGDGDGAESGAASDAATSNRQERAKPRGTAETRLSELLGDLKRAGLTPAELKTFKREAQAAATAAAPSAAPPAAAPAAQAPATPQAQERPAKPKVADFETYSEYEEARDAWQAAETRFAIADALADERRKTADAEASKRNEAMLAEAAGRYGADAGDVIKATAKALVGNAAIPGVIRAMFGDTPVLGDLLYVMGSKPDELSAFLDLAQHSPGEAVRKLALVEHLVKEELAKAKPSAAKADGETPRAGDGKFVAAAATPPVKKITSAPAPPSETGGRQAAPADEVEQAATAKDFRAYRRAANERDLAARNGR